MEFFSAFNMIEIINLTSRLISRTIVFIVSALFWRWWHIRQQQLEVCIQNLVPAPPSPISVHRVSPSLYKHDGLFVATSGPSDLLHWESPSLNRWCDWSAWHDQWVQRNTPLTQSWIWCISWVPQSSGLNAASLFPVFTLGLWSNN